MKYPGKEQLAQLKERYMGKTIELLAMPDDPRPVPVGTKGTVYFVDDAGQLCVNWENGSTLSVCLDAGDQVKII